MSLCRGCAAWDMILEEQKLFQQGKRFAATISVQEFCQKCENYPYKKPLDHINS